MNLIKEFQEFAVKGNVIDMGVGIVIGAAFTSIVNSLVIDIFGPLIALVTTGVNFSEWFITLRTGDVGGPYSTLDQAQLDNAITINAGIFLNSVISFLVVALIIFFLIRAINRLKRPEQVTADPVHTKECTACFSVISEKATRCPYCTTQLERPLN